jgi:hypothetical protein
MKLEPTVVLTPHEVQLIDEIMNYQSIDNSMSVEAFKALIIKMEHKYEQITCFITSTHDELCPTPAPICTRNKFNRVYATL